MEKICGKQFRVTIFGSARIKRGDPIYNRVCRLARLIAKEGMDVITGGGPGLMEAANKGHKKGRKRDDICSYGLTMRFPAEPCGNEHLDIEKDFKKFSNRLDHFMLMSNAVVVAPGGIGTLLEFFYAWQLLQVKHIRQMPIILLGPMWKDLIEWMKETQIMRKLADNKDLDNIYLVRNCAEAMWIIKKAHKLHLECGDNVCINLKKYKLRMDKK